MNSDNCEVMPHIDTMAELELQAIFTLLAVGDVHTATIALQQFLTYVHVALHDTVNEHSN